MSGAPSPERKLAAIVVADVVGYSRLMGANETDTHARLKTLHDAVFTPKVKEYRGRIVKLMGDGILAEFPSVVDALACMVEAQRALVKHNEDVDEKHRIVFRIGVHLGDIIVDDDDIYGDGVNIAARIEPLSDPGGICISQAALDAVGNKLALEYEAMGAQQVKNIAQPVRAYRVRVPPGAAMPQGGGEAAQHPSNATAPGGEQKFFKSSRMRLAVVAALALLLAGLSATALWYSYIRPASTQIASKKSGAREMPARPSIAVLPFRNLSGDSGQDYFSDGITDDIITDLSKFRDLFIIASNTVFNYKDRSVKVKDVSRELGVRYVLEGSVLKVDRKVRINAQLIDGASERHLWAERFVRDTEDLFALQDEIVQTIVGTLAVRVDAAERGRIMRKGTQNLDAYDHLLRGREYRSRTTAAANTHARGLFQQAIALDPRYAAAYVSLGGCYLDAVRYGWTASPSQALQQAHDLAQKALSLEESSAAAHRLLGTVYLKWTEYDLATDELERALELNPNDADTHDALGAVRLYTGQPVAAIESIDVALRFDPQLQTSSFIHLGLAYYLTERYEDAIRTMQRSLDRNPDLVVHHIVLAAAYARAGRTEDAARAAAMVRRLHPFFEVELFGSAFRDTADRTKLAEGLRKAGLD